ncbi:hypothetical protein H0H93_001232 [Arthromyces matolae]|nr:hypothetical protein H0H93_001232 [Arthromyces matolae]
MGTKGRRPPASDQESDLEQPPSKAFKPASAKRISKHSEGILEADKENLAKAQAKIVRLEKQLHCQKAMGVNESDRNEGPTASEPEVESEEEDEQVGYSSSQRATQDTTSPHRLSTQQISAVSRTATSSPPNVNTQPTGDFDIDEDVINDTPGLDNHVELDTERSSSDVDSESTLREVFAFCKKALDSIVVSSVTTVKNAHLVLF